ncbi:hypothetical protein H7J87_15290 [Mycolicibacterium wolinskyi]|uniref:Uncharacterized protein n=1 Tax=Mycolicibacterium wolinskyi TaxID=59750 RepID=A0A1X2F8B9_9MYCO|nr:MULTISPECIES: hypothetical protein [Mycolicibacterium]MCV7286691.1 hypothetical protein [Mycolicibacterium wolinskyi]MCV7293671.1 hypothetical protein [Mycolicibacterium goodii]ORX14608.1 hypothetical protein AWC31_25840 [Mycolicibacterium wolinskyi]
MGVPTHVMVFCGDIAQTMGREAGPQQFLAALRSLDGAENWFILLYALPHGGAVAEHGPSHPMGYIRAVGRADEMAVEICQPDIQQSGAIWVRSIVGHPHDGTPTLDVPITSSGSAEIVSRAELFDAVEAAQLFTTYHRNGDIPPGYVLRPAESYAEGSAAIGLYRQENLSACRSV